MTRRHDAEFDKRLAEMVDRLAVAEAISSKADDSKKPPKRVVPDIMADIKRELGAKKKRDR